MSAPIDDASITVPGSESPAAATTDPKPAAKPSLEDSLSALDEDTRTFVLAELSSARTEAKNLRERLKAGQPKIADYDRRVAEAKTAEQRHTEALEQANQRATAAIQRVARAEVKAALAGVVDNPDAIVEDLNLARFIDSDGEIDPAAVKALRDKYAGFSAPRSPRPDASQASAANGRTKTDPATEFASFIKAQIGR